MEDMKTLMPHSKSESKMRRNKESLFIVNEIAEMKNCNKCLLFEGRKKRDLYLWAANIARGPSAKFRVINVHTMAELKMTGNCLKGSRPLLSFDQSFKAEENTHYALLKELFIQVSPEILLMVINGCWHQLALFDIIMQFIKIMCFLQYDDLLQETEGNYELNVFTLWSNHVKLQFQITTVPLDLSL